MAKKAVYSGTFDPFTKGHLSVVERAANIFDEVIIAIAEDNYKKTLFTTLEREEQICATVAALPNVRVAHFSGLLVDFVRELGAVAIIRGLRVVTDFEYEMQMAAFNKHLCPTVDTVFLTASSEYSYVSSSMVKNISELNGDISFFVSPEVDAALKKKFNEKRP